ncbi:MAG: hypothetical protein R3C49_12115 [Planctomycetaceae bacterium]
MPKIANPVSPDNPFCVECPGEVLELVETAEIIGAESSPVYWPEAASKAAQFLEPASGLAAFPELSPKSPADNRAHLHPAAKN